MDRKSLPRLSDILEAISLIKDFVEDQNLDDFLKDIKCQKAVLFQFIIIGEAVKNIDEPFFHLLQRIGFYRLAIRITFHLHRSGNKRQVLRQGHVLLFFGPTRFCLG